MPSVAAVPQIETPTIENNFSLVVGAPFWKMLRRVGIIGVTPLPERRIVSAVLLTWIPLLLLAQHAGTAFGHKVTIPLLSDFSLYGRILVAIPILIIAEVVIDPWLGRVVSTFASSCIVRERDLPAYRSILASIMRLRDSGLAELLLFFAACFPMFLLAEEEWMITSVSSWHHLPGGGFSPAGWWYVLVSTSILRFVLYRWLWRYSLWCALLYRIGRLDLNMMPTHPDELGGLGFVVMAQKHFGILSAALGSILAGMMANNIVYFGKTLTNSRGQILIFMILSILGVLGPLLALAPKLAAVRREGLAQYSQLARDLSQDYSLKWVHGTREESEALITSPDTSSLADYSTCYNLVRGMQVIPITRQLVIQVALQAGAPFVFVVLVGTPTEEIVRWIFKMFV